MTRDAAQPLRGARVLVVEDESALGELLRLFLERAGAAVEVARSVAGARALAFAHRWHLAVLDIDLPDGNGIDLLLQLRMDPDRRTLPAVFVTGRFDAPRCRRIAALPHADLLGKPFASQQLIGAATLLLLAACRPAPPSG